MICTSLYELTAFLGICPEFFYVGLMKFLKIRVEINGEKLMTPDKTGFQVPQEPPSTTLGCGWLLVEPVGYCDGGGDGGTGAWFEVGGHTWRSGRARGRVQEVGDEGGGSGGWFEVSGRTRGAGQ